MSFQSRKTEESFDETYMKNEEMFGGPYQELREYFAKHEPKGSVLDVGAGQGRDALYLASLGYHVTAIDSSAVGIEQMLVGAKDQGVEIDGVVSDVMDTKIDKKYDIILFDMLLHAFEEREQNELVVKYAQYVDAHGMMCMIFPDDVSTENVLFTLNAEQDEWELADTVVIKDIPQIGDEKIDYTFVMLCVRRV